MTGKFITFEGGEGTGKSTQAKLLYAGLKERGVDVILTREPGGSPGAEEIRKLLVEGEPGRWEPDAEVCLFLAARCDHISKLIRPALEKGTWVISDRFYDSSFVYQGLVRGFGVPRLEALHHYLFRDFAPDLTIILDAATKVSLTRAKPGRFEKFGPEFHNQVRDEYRTIAAAHPNRCVVVDANRHIDPIYVDVLSIVDETFNQGVPSGN